MKDIALPRSLKISIAVILCLTVFVFSFLGMSINTMSENTIENIGTTYMSGMNEQVSLHFETIIDLRLTMAESIAHIAADEETSSYGSKEEIEYGAKARHFLCAALYSSDGRIEMIYGDPIELNHPELFLESLKRGERKTASGFDSSGNDVILFGVPCEYPMTDGNTSLAMIVGLSSRYMGEVLFLDSDESLISSYVIRKDGSYVVRSEGSPQENYFDRIYNVFEGQNKEADSYINQMTAALEDGGFLEAARRLIQEERPRLAAELGRLGLRRRVRLRGRAGKVRRGNRRGLHRRRNRGGRLRRNGHR